MEYVITNGGSPIYPAGWHQIVAAVQSAQPEGVEIGLPKDLSGLDLTPYGVFPVSPTEPPETAPNEVALRDGVESVAGGWCWKWKTETVTPDVPFAVSMRQARLALLAAGLLDDVEAAVQAAGQAAQIEWEYAAEVQRTSSLISALTPALGLTEQQVDDLFIAAGAIG